MLKKKIHYQIRITSMFLICVGNLIYAAAQSVPSNIALQDSLTAVSLNESLHDSLRASAFYLLGRLNIEKNPTLTRDCISKGSVLAIKAGKERLSSGFAMLDITLKLMQGDFVNALNECKGLESKIRRLDYPDLTASWMNQLATIYYRMGEYDQAGELYNKVINIAREHDFHDSEVKAIVNLGVMHENRREYVQMRDQMILAWNLAKEYGLQNEMLLARFNQAVAENQLNNFGQAITCFEEILPLYESQNNQYGTAYCLANLSTGYLEIRQYERAMACARRSETIRMRLNDQPGLSRLQLIMGRIYMETMRFDSAEVCFNKGIKMASANGQTPLLTEGYEWLSKLYFREKNYENAYNAHRTHQIWHDSVYQKNKDERLQQQFNLFKVTYLDSLAVSRNAELGNITREKSLLWLLLVLLVPGLTILGWRYWNSRVFHHPGNSESAYSHKVKELETSNTTLEKELVMLQAEKRRLECESEPVERDLDILRAVARNSGNWENYWSEFLSRFSGVYPHFFDALNERYPGLTQNELRFCALMKINLSLLDTANALNISPESVRKARYRLYKKMELESDQDLAEMMIRL